MIKIKILFFKQWALISVIILFIIASLLFFINPFEINSSFFGEDKTPAEILTYIGVLCGAVIVLGTLYATNRRNNVSERGNLNTRFKDAAMLLNENSTYANLVGIFTLHKMAEDLYDINKDDEYIDMIQNILCAFIRENARYKTEKNMLGKDEIVIDYNNKRSIVFQTVIDVLFRKRDIYGKYERQLYRTAFRFIKFNNANLNNVNFSNSIFETDNHFDGAKFGKIDDKGGKIRFYSVKINGKTYKNIELNELKNLCECK